MLARWVREATDIGFAGLPGEQGLKVFLLLFFQKKKRSLPFTASPTFYFCEENANALDIL